MGNYRCRRPGFLEAWKITAAELMFQSVSDLEIANRLWPLPEGLTDKQRQYKTKANKEKLQRLRKDPKFLEYYRSIYTEWQVHNASKALNKLSEQVDSAEPWLANKAANDVLGHCKNLLASDEENSVTIKFEGMPELGSPDTDKDNG